MPLERIQPKGLQIPKTYSQVVKAGNTVYVAGQTAGDANGQPVGKGDITAQATQVMENLKEALASAGADFRHVTKMTVYLTDARYREAVGDVRAKYFTSGLPASTLLVVSGLASPDYLLEIEVIAVID